MMAVQNGCNLLYLYLFYQVLKPMMLRRLKEDVEKSLAPKEETIVEVCPNLNTLDFLFYDNILLG